jgi:uncharacterized membrane protein
MISELVGTDGVPRAFVVRPNPPMPWGVLLRVYAGMAAFVLAVGTGCAMVGLPLVLPFSGIEVLVLGAALYVSARRAAVREVIRIGGASVIYERGLRSAEQRVEFHRHWARVVLQQNRSGWQPSRLLLRSHGREVEAGSFLEEGERLALARMLRHALHQPRLGTAHRSISIMAEQCRGLEHGA